MAVMVWRSTTPLRWSLWVVAVLEKQQWSTSKAPSPPWPWGWLAKTLQHCLSLSLSSACPKTAASSHNHCPPSYLRTSSTPHLMVFNRTAKWSDWECQLALAPIRPFRCNLIYFLGFFFLSFFFFGWVGWREGFSAVMYEYQYCIYWRSHLIVLCSCVVLF